MRCPCHSVTADTLKSDNVTLPLEKKNLWWFSYDHQGKKVKHFSQPLQSIYSKSLGAYDTTVTVIKFAQSPHTHMWNPNVLTYLKVKHFRGDGAGGTPFSWVEWVSCRIERIRRSTSPGPPLEDTGRFIGQLRIGSIGCLLLTSWVIAIREINFWPVFMSPVNHSSQRALPQLCLFPCGSLRPFSASHTTLSSQFSPQLPRAVPFWRPKPG